MSNKSLNPLHLKYSMDPYGEIKSNFERHFEEITKSKDMEELANNRENAKRDERE